MYYALPKKVTQYTLQPGHLKIIEGPKQSTAVLDPLQDLLKRLPNSYTLLSPLQVEVVQGNGSVKMQYVPVNSKADTIEVNSKSIDEGERLMRSALGEAWRRYLIMKENSLYVNDKVQAIGQELSDIIK